MGEPSRNELLSQMPATVSIPRHGERPLGQLEACFFGGFSVGRGRTGRRPIDRSQRWRYYGGWYTGAGLVLVIQTLAIHENSFYTLRLLFCHMPNSATTAFQSTEPGLSDAAVDAVVPLALALPRPTDPPCPRRFFLRGPSPDACKCLLAPRF